MEDNTTDSRVFLSHLLPDQKREVIAMFIFIGISSYLEVTGDFHTAIDPWMVKKIHGTQSYYR